MTQLPFCKMHGAGNDFVVLDAVSAELQMDASRARRIADRRRGVGCDQILILSPPQRPEQDFNYRIFNSDGSEAGQCGNGARCAAHFVHLQGLSARPELLLGTRERTLRVRRLGDGDYSANLGEPLFAPQQVPMIADSEAPLQTLNLGADELQIAALSLGNPQAVLFVDDLEGAQLDALGPAISAHRAFPDGANVGFARVLRDALQLRVWERGSGETGACGSGACARRHSGGARRAAVASRRRWRCGGADAGRRAAGALARRGRRASVRAVRSGVPGAAAPVIMMLSRVRRPP